MISIELKENQKAWIVLMMNTLAFTICFACWMMNGVLVTYLVQNNLFDWDKAQVGWLIGIPVLTGSIVRLPLGVLTDKYGGRIIYTWLMLFSALAMFYVSYANNYFDFMIASLGFGITGGSFAVGIAYTSVWFKKERQGTVLGIFGAGNAGAALTSVFAPRMLDYFTNNGANLEGWRQLPIVYASSLVVMTVFFYLFTYSKKVSSAQSKTLLQRLEPLKHLRVHRFGLYYFFVFGGFVALAQWLIPYYVNVYGFSVATAGLMAAIFSFPSGVIRALGGWMSDKFGARKVMYWVFGSCLICSVLLMIPRMEIYTPGKGVQADRDGTVVSISPSEIVVKNTNRVDSYSFVTKQSDFEDWRTTDELWVWPKKQFWQEPVVQLENQVVKKQLLVRGVTYIFFQANVWIFTVLVFIIGIMMGIGKAAVYKHIPEYFPDDVGVVGGVVGVIGGLGGFISPIIFGYLLRQTGIWTTCWIFFAVLAAVLLWWMHRVIQQMIQAKAPELIQKFDR